MKEYNEVMRIFWENGEEKWGFTPRQDEGENEQLRETMLEMTYLIGGLFDEIERLQKELDKK
jgi:hypothetical protein